MSTKLIIFDFDGTLGDTRRNIVTTMQMTISEMGLPCRSEQECASTIGLPLASCFETLFSAYENHTKQRNNSHGYYDHNCCQEHYFRSY